MSRPDFERTYGELNEGTTIRFTNDLDDPEVQAAIRDISGPQTRVVEKEISNVYYAIWITSTVLAVAIAYAIGVSSR